MFQTLGWWTRPWQLLQVSVGTPCTWWRPLLPQTPSRRGRTPGAPKGLSSPHNALCIESWSFEAGWCGLGHCYSKNLDIWVYHVALDLVYCPKLSSCLAIRVPMFCHSYSSRWRFFFALPLWLFYVPWLWFSTSPLHGLELFFFPTLPAYEAPSGTACVVSFTYPPLSLQQLPEVARVESLVRWKKGITEPRATSCVSGTQVPLQCAASVPSCLKGRWSQSLLWRLHSGTPYLFPLLSQFFMAKWPSIGPWRINGGMDHACLSV